MNGRTIEQKIDEYLFKHKDKYFGHVWDLPYKLTVLSIFNSNKFRDYIIYRGELDEFIFKLDLDEIKAGIIYLKNKSEQLRAACYAKSGPHIENQWFRALELKKGLKIFLNCSARNDNKDSAIADFRRETYPFCADFRRETYPFCGSEGLDISNSAGGIKSHFI